MAKNYTPKPINTEQKVFDITELNYYVRKEEFAQSIKHIEYRLGQSEKSLESINDNLDKRIDEKLVTFKLKFKEDQKNSNSSFWWKVVPIIISIIAVIIGILF